MRWKIQKNANHYLEGVLSFSFDKFAKNKDEFRAKAPKLIEEYGKNIAAEYGFEYLGFSLHFDECFQVVKFLLCVWGKGMSSTCY